MTLDEAARARVAVWGLGQEGLAMVHLLQERGATPVLIDDHAEAAGARLERSTGQGSVVMAPGDVVWGNLDVLIRSPGVSRYREELVGAKRAGV